jgi:hypothetical protein
MKINLPRAVINTAAISSFRWLPDIGCVLISDFQGAVLIVSAQVRNLIRGLDCLKLTNFNTRLNKALTAIERKVADLGINLIAMQQLRFLPQSLKIHSQKFHVVTQLAGLIVGIACFFIVAVHLKKDFCFHKTLKDASKILHGLHFDFKTKERFSGNLHELAIPGQCATSNA